MRQSLSFILMLSLAGLQFLAILIFVFTSFLTSERAMLIHAQELMSQAGNNAKSHVQSFLKPARDIASEAVGLIESGIVDVTAPADLERLLFEKVLTMTQVSGVYYGDAWGNFNYVMRSDGPGPFRTKLVARNGDSRETNYIWRDLGFAQVDRASDPEDTFDPRARPWYQSASDTGAAIWTDPYIFFSSGKPGITAALPVLNADGAIQGVVGVDIQLDAIADFLASLKISDRSTIILMDGEGRVIAHPDFENSTIASGDGARQFADIAQTGDPVAGAAFGNLPAVDPGSDQTDQLRVGTETYLTLVTPIDVAGVPWRIAIHAPENDFIQRIKDNRRRNIWIAAGISLATALVGLLLAEYILRPVRAFAVRTALVSQGEVTPNTPLPSTYRELKRANETLIDEIAQRRESETKLRTLSQQLFHFSRVDLMGQLATGLAHELSQPITAITQNVDAALSTAAKSHPEDAALMEILRELDDQAHRGGDIIRALRSLVQKDEGASEPFAINELIEQTLRLITTEAETYAVALDFTPGPEHFASANRVQIAQVLINLVQNAIEAMTNAHSPQRMIRVTTESDGTWIEVQVTDTGPGISADKAVFRHFETSKAEGMGFGLSLSKTIVEANGGHIWNDAAHEGGARFAFTLPLAEPRTKAAE